MHSALYAALLGLLLVILSLRVVRLRRARRVSLGAGGDAEVERAMRVQANCAEYAPLFLVMLGFAELQGLTTWAIHALGGAFLLGRVLHFAGFRSPEAPGAARVAGTALTFTALAALAAVMLTMFVQNRIF